MIRRDVEERLVDEREDDGYLYPDYGGYCFGSVPGTLDALLGADVPDDRTLPEDVFDGVDAAVDNVAVVLLDGYGFDAWRRDHDSVPLLSALSDRGTVTPLTSIYPSETAAAILTWHSGQYPVEHGQIGWDVYYEEFGGVVQPLPFTTPDGEPAEEAYPGATREALDDAEPRYGRLRDAGVSVTFSEPAKIVDDPETGEDGPAIEPYEEPGEMAAALCRTLEDHAGDGRDYCYGYMPQVDAAAHVAGTESDRYREALTETTGAVRRELVEPMDREVAEDTLLVLTADHGILDTGENVDLEDGFDAVRENLRRTPGGDPIPPVGSPRNVHLFLREGTVGTVREELEDRLDCVTFTREEAIDRGLFGPASPGPSFRRRCGDLVVVGRDRGIWYEDDGFVGMHGGLAPEEMLVPFAAARVADLQ